MESHLFRLSQISPQNKTAGGLRLEATKANFPKLKGMSFYKLVLAKNGVREPHWHANADELGFCLKGQILLSIFASGNIKTRVLVKQGEAFFIPSGALHALTNVGDIESEVLLQFSNDQPEDFSLSSAFGMFTKNVLGNTWHVSADTFQEMKLSTAPTFSAIRNFNMPIEDEWRYVSPYKYNLANSRPITMNEGGQVQVARQDVWPILRNQSLYNLKLTGKGMREPHWHPETAELGYVAQGKGRMSIQSPNGDVETYEISEGDIYFIPKAYPHHIENLLEAPLHILIFFDQPLPRDIGFSASVKSFDLETLESTLHAPKELFEKLPTYFSDLLIVEKVNPVDRPPK